MAGLLWWLGRVRVAVRDGEFLVDDARLPVRFVADVVALDLEGRREVLSVGAHPLAFVVQRPWIAGAVQVVLDDPADPTPVLGGQHPASGTPGGGDPRRTRRGPLLTALEREDTRGDPDHEVAADRR